MCIIMVFDYWAVLKQFDKLSSQESKIGNATTVCQRTRKELAEAASTVFEGAQGLLGIKTCVTICQWLWEVESCQLLSSCQPPNTYSKSSSN